MFNSLKVVKPIDAGEASKLKSFTFSRSYQTDPMGDIGREVRILEQSEKDLPFPIKTIEYEIKQLLVSLIDKRRNEELRFILEGALTQILQKYIDPGTVEYQLSVDKNGMSIQYRDLSKNKITVDNIKLEFV